jgi:hypothetical protein
MTLQLLHYEFPYILGKFDFLFISVANQIVIKFTYRSPYYLTYETSVWLLITKHIHEMKGTTGDVVILYSILFGHRRAQ